MAARKIEVNEDDLKKIILILKLSRPYLKIPSSDLVLQNLWRISVKLSDKLIRKAGFTLVTTKGRMTLKNIDESNKVEDGLIQSKQSEETSEVFHRCRKRKK